MGQAVEGCLREAAAAKAATAKGVPWDSGCCAVQWEVDLQETVAVNTVLVWNRVDCCGGR